jgi:hypothetical protein
LLFVVVVMASECKTRIGVGGNQDLNDPNVIYFQTREELQRQVDVPESDPVSIQVGNLVPTDSLAGGFMPNQSCVSRVV